ncbi:MAG: bifunctional demethylmenaquinone methyltransferase/2-methoxy-6-polyprenyl-1,4-benzoquinol methylase UbiE [Vampirovibrionales bacterium]|nr:bifunctional demethylmenaquinone methyltransferase/2-methoxy-6-polyprenyl-1,4-benzoquinol methylase UbiE [Vampirovibrionales bacterium]
MPSPEVQPYTLPEPARKPHYVQALFSRIAGHYDLMNDVMTFGLHRRWKARACRALRLEAGQRALDLCCGTGDLALEILRQTPTARVVGVDFCEEMLAIARRRLRDAPCELMQGDAMRLPFEDDAFDGVVIAYGLRNVADAEGCLREIARVLRPGGRLAILEMSRPTPLLHGLSRGWRFAILPILGRLIARDGEAYQYLPHSAQAFPPQHALVEMMTRVGLQDARFENLMGGVCALHVAVAP